MHSKVQQTDKFWLLLKPSTVVVIIIMGQVSNRKVWLLIQMYLLVIEEVISRIYWFEEIIEDMISVSNK